MELQTASQVNEQTEQLTPIRESSFRAELHDAVNRQDKTSFNYLLSMLTDNALDFDQFHLPKDKPQQYKTDLANEFGVQSKPIVKESSAKRSALHNELVLGGHQQTLLLDLCLKPEPLVQPSQTIKQEVVNNLGYNQQVDLINSQTRIKQDCHTETVEDKSALDLNTWFNQIHQARLYSQVA